MNFLHSSVLHYTNEIKPVTHMYIIIHTVCQNVDTLNDSKFSLQRVRSVVLINVISIVIYLY